MVKRLTSFLKNRIEWKLLVDSVVAAAILFLAVVSDFSWWAIVLFFIWLVRVYLAYQPRLKIFWFSFWLLPVLALINPASPIGPIGLMGPIGFAVFLFLLLGISNFLFKNTSAVYDFFNTFLILLVFLLFFAFASPTWLGLLLLFVGISLIFREFLIVHGLTWQKRIWLVSVVLSFLAVELSWFVSFLPLGFVNAAVFLALFLMVVRDSVLAHFQGDLRLSFIFRQLTIFVVVAIIVFATSRWNL